MFLYLVTFPETFYFYTFLQDLCKLFYKLSSICFFQTFVFSETVSLCLKYFLFVKLES